MNSLVNDKLVETRNNLVQEIAILNDVQFNGKFDTDSWSIAQVCHHVVLVEETTIKAIAWGLKESKITQKERKEMEPILLDRTKKIRAPKIVEPDETPFEVQQIMDLLNNSREKLMTFLTAFRKNSSSSIL